MSLSNSSLGNLGSNKCCDLKGEGPIGPQGPQGVRGPIGPNGNIGPTGLIGSTGKLVSGLYGFIDLSSQVINPNTPFSIPLTGSNLNNESYYSVNASVCFAGLTGITGAVNPNISFNYSEQNLSTTYTYYPSIFGNSGNVVNNPSYLQSNISGSTYFYSGSVNDWFNYNPTYNTDFVVNKNINFYVSPASIAGATYRIKITSAITPVN